MPQQVQRLRAVTARAQTELDQLRGHNAILGQTRERAAIMFGVAISERLRNFNRGIEARTEEAENFLLLRTEVCENLVPSLNATLVARYRETRDAWPLS